MGFRLICKIAQETPMIHFQHEEIGACIRASELKPKLDRFIINNKKEKEEIPSEWCLKKSTKDEEENNQMSTALDYKVKIRANGLRESWKDTELKGYFGNLGSGSSENDKKKGILYEEGLELIIMCFIPSLLEEIKENIEGFFLLTNFGTRQSKGFGGFRIKEILTDDGKIIRCEGGRRLLNIVKKYYKKSIYGHKYKESCEIGKRERLLRLQDIYMIYGLMKSGFNFTKIKNSSKDDYYKGFIFRYFMQKPHVINNDKAFMKSHIFDSVKDEEYFFIRVLLGLTDNYIFIKNHEEKIEILVNDKKEEIERFQSPITFKVFDQYLIMLLDEIPSELLDREFDFFDGEKKLGTIRTPSEFDLTDFIEAFISDFNTKEGVEHRNDLRKVQHKQIKNAAKMKIERLI